MIVIENVCIQKNPCIPMYTAVYKTSKQETPLWSLMDWRGRFYDSWSGIDVRGYRIVSEVCYTKISPKFDITTEFS